MLFRFISLSLSLSLPLHPPQCSVVRFPVRHKKLALLSEFTVALRSRSSPSLSISMLTRRQRHESFTHTCCCVYRWFSINCFGVPPLCCLPTQRSIQFVTSLGRWWKCKHISLKIISFVFFNIICFLHFCCWVENTNEHFQWCWKKKLFLVYECM